MVKGADLVTNVFFSEYGLKCCFFCQFILMPMDPAYKLLARLFVIFSPVDSVSKIFCTINKTKMQQKEYKQLHP